MAGSRANAARYSGGLFIPKWVHMRGLCVPRFVAVLSRVLRGVSCQLASQQVGNLFQVLGILSCCSLLGLAANMKQATCRAQMTSPSLGPGQSQPPWREIQGGMSTGLRDVVNVWCFPPFWLLPMIPPLHTNLRPSDLSLHSGCLAKMKRPPPRPPPSPPPPAAEPRYCSVRHLAPRAEVKTGCRHFV